MRHAAALSLTLLLVACSGSDLEVRDAWVRTAPPGANAMAAYLVIEYHGDTPLHVTGASSPYFRRVMIHQTLIENDVARMVHTPGLELVPGTAMHLEPGGRHIMLMGPERPISTGMAVPITLTLDDGRVLEVSAMVRPGP